MSEGKDLSMTQEEGGNGYVWTGRQEQWENYAFFDVKKTWDQWISLLEEILYTGNYCCLCHQLRQSVFDVAACGILLFGYWLHCGS